MTLNKTLFTKKHLSNRDNFEAIFKFVDGTVTLLGCRALSDRRVYWWSYSPMFIVVMYWMLAIFTVHFHTDHQQFDKALPSLCLLGISISVSGKLFENIFESKKNVIPINNI